MISNKVKFSGYVRLPKPTPASTLKDIEVGIPNEARTLPKIPDAPVEVVSIPSHTPIEFGGATPL
jgi:hypothetical protein